MNAWSSNTEYFYYYNIFRCKKQAASSNVAATNDATSSSAIGIENPAPANDSEANDVGCQTDPTKEDELLRQYQSELLSRNEEVYQLRAENDRLTRKSKALVVLCHQGQ